MATLDDAKGPCLQGAHDRPAVPCVGLEKKELQRSNGLSRNAIAKEIETAIDRSPQRLPLSVRLFAKWKGKALPRIGHPGHWFRKLGIDRVIDSGIYLP